MLKLWSHVHVPTDCLNIGLTAREPSHTIPAYPQTIAAYVIIHPKFSSRRTRIKQAGKVHTAHTAMSVYSNTICDNDPPPTIHMTAKIKPPTQILNILLEQRSLNGSSRFT